ncbi:hypothetical protein ACP70R_022870 [Stipagrostis hirtigluma subsp. patula]
MVRTYSHVLIVRLELRRGFSSPDSVSPSRQPANTSKFPRIPPEASQSAVIMETAAAALPEWVLLDRFVFRRSSSTDVDDSDTTSAECRTSTGVSFSVSFRLAAPPATSRIYLHWPDSDAAGFSVVGSHRDAVLFSLFPSAPREDFSRSLYTRDLFVYRAGGGDKQPSLTLLPSWADHLTRAERKSLPPIESWFLLSDLKSLGILRTDDQEIVVAHLRVGTSRGCYDLLTDVFAADMYIFSSSTMKWQHRVLPIGGGGGDTREDLSNVHNWSTNTVIPFRTYLCWVDYLVGVLFFDTATEDCSQVTFVALPVDNSTFLRDFMDSGVSSTAKICMDMYRTVSVVGSEDGPLMMRFVDVTPLDGYHRTTCSSGCKVTCWTLVVTEEDHKMVWQKDAVIQPDDLCLDTFFPFPHEPLKFPVMSVDNPRIIYFVLGEIGFHIKKVWVVTVDTITRTVLSVLPYLKREEDLRGDDADMAKRKSYRFQPFLPTEISKFLNKGRTSYE